MLVRRHATIIGTIGTILWYVSKNCKRENAVHFYKRVQKNVCSDYNMDVSSERCVPIVANTAFILTLIVASVVVIPTEHLLSPIGNYSSDFTVVAGAMGERIYRQFALVMVIWIGPAFLAFTVPKRWTRPLFHIVALTYCVILWTVVLLVWNEWPRLGTFLRNDPAAGYMCHDVILLLLIASIANVHKPLAPGGPLFAVTFFDEESVSRVPAVVYVALAIASILMVLPTQHRYIDDDGQLFLVGYSTDSIVATVVSTSMIATWVVVFHLVGTLARQTYNRMPLRSLAFLLTGTALVELYVGAAFAACAAYAKATRI